MGHHVDHHPKANFMIHEVPDKDYIIGLRGQNVEDFSVYKIKDVSPRCPASANYVYDGTAKKCKEMTRMVQSGILKHGFQSPYFASEI